MYIFPLAVIDSWPHCWLIGVWRFVTYLQCVLLMAFMSGFLSCFPYQLLFIYWCVCFSFSGLYFVCFVWFGWSVFSPKMIGFIFPWMSLSFWSIFSFDMMSDFIIPDLIFQVIFKQLFLIFRLDCRSIWFQIDFQLIYEGLCHPPAELWSLYGCLIIIIVIIVIIHGLIWSEQIPFCRVGLRVQCPKFPCRSWRWSILRFLESSPVLSVPQLVVG